MVPRPTYFESKRYLERLPFEKSGKLEFPVKRSSSRPGARSTREHLLGNTLKLLLKIFQSKSQCYQVQAFKVAEHSFRLVSSVV